MIFRSPLPDVAIPSATLADYALANVDAHATRAAFIDASSERVVTHGDAFFIQGQVMANAVNTALMNDFKRLQTSANHGF